MPATEFPSTPVESAENDALETADLNLDGPPSASILENRSEDQETRIQNADRVVSTAAAGADASAQSVKQRAWYWRWIDSPVALLAILFLVTGAFGLPLLYHSRAFSTRMKWMVGIANVVYTVLSCYWAYLEVSKSIATISEVISAM